MAVVEQREDEMTASDLRRGPGWWMDPDGNWNPPEVWPESTPPLPGWTRNGDGTWQSPVAPAATVIDEPTIDPEPTDPQSSGQPAPRPVSEILNGSTPVAPPATATGPGTRNEHSRPTAASLGYGTYTRVEPTELPASEVTLRKAVLASIGAALTSAMLAAGLTVLLGVI